jgi:pimeloyl-ACP methyl ester carboxylesterase
MDAAGASSSLRRLPLLREGLSGVEAARLVRHPILRGVGVTDAGGQPVMLIPGFLAGDRSLAVMTRWLRRTGHDTEKAGMRANVDCSEATIARLLECLERLSDRAGGPAAIVGHSRGGSLARVAAVRRPDLVSGIVTLASPVLAPLAVHPFLGAHVRAVSTLGSLGAPGFFREDCLRGECCSGFRADTGAPFPDEVRFVAVYSRGDGVVDWRACLDPAAKHVEVRASHLGMPLNADAFAAVAGALEAFRGAESGA